MVNFWFSFFMTYTFRTKVCVDTLSTAIPTIKVTIYIVGFIIAETIAFQGWSCTSNIPIADTFITIFCVDIRSTTITAIIVAFKSICVIITITIIQYATGFTALKIKFKCLVCFKVLYVRKKTHSLMHLPQSRNKKVQVQVC